MIDTGLDYSIPVNELTTSIFVHGWEVFMGICLKLVKCHQQIFSRIAPSSKLISW